MVANDLLVPELSNLLKISPDIQIDLLKRFVECAGAAPKGADDHGKDLLSIRQALLDDILARVQEKLNTDDCWIYIKDSPSRATLRAARGDQQYRVGKAMRRIVPASSVKDKPAASDRLGLTSWVISTGRSFLVTKPGDFFDHSHWSAKYDKPREKAGDDGRKSIAAFLAIPLRDSRGQVIGALEARRSKPSKPFSVEDQITLDALGQIAGRCIAYVDDALNGPLDAAITSWALKIFSDAGTTEGELDSFLDIVVRVSAAVTQADACSVFLVDESRRTLTQRAGCGHQGLKNIIRSYSLPDRSKLAGCIDLETCSPASCLNKLSESLSDDERVGITAWVAATGKSFYANSKEELRQHCHHKGQFDRQNFEQQKELDPAKVVAQNSPLFLEECSAWFGTPLVVGGIPIGVLKIENKTPIGKLDTRQFSSEVKQRLGILAQDTAISIRRLQIQGKTRYEVINKAMPTILTILQGGLEIPQLVKRVVMETAFLFNARTCALFLREGDKLIQPKWAAYGYASQTNKEGTADRLREYQLVSPKDILPDPPLEKKVGLTVWIAVTKTKFYARSNQELKLHPHHRGLYDPLNFSENERCESFMGVPLLVGEEKDLVGVLKVETKQRKIGDKTDYSYFNEQDALVFDLISNSVAIAIQNARLLASRRMADRFLLQPNRSNTLREAFRFIDDRVDVLNTLEGAARNVAERDNRKATILKSVIGVLEPEFNLGVLEQLAYQISDSRDSSCVALTGLLKMLARMINVQDWADIYKIDVNDFQTVDWFDSQFMLHECIKSILDVHHCVSELLRAYDLNESYVLALKECLVLLSDQIQIVEFQNLFVRNVLHRIFTRWKTLIEVEYVREHEIPNPYVAGLPLEADSAVFFGREEIFKWIEKRLHGEKGTLILHGGWHTGKTSILKQIMGGPMGVRIRERDAVIPAYFDLQRFADSGTGTFLFSLADGIAKALQEHGIIAPAVEKEKFEGAFYLAFTDFLTQVSIKIQEHGKRFLVIMLDEFERLYLRVRTSKLDPEIFEYLRSLMQHESQVSFILAGRHRLDEMELEVRTPIFNVAYHNEIGFLNPEEAKRLIVDPVKPYAVEYEQEEVDRILKLTAGHPYFIQQLCRNCVDVLNERKAPGYRVTAKILDEALRMALHNNVTLEDLWKSELDEKDRRIVTMLAETIPPQDDTWVKESQLLEDGRIGAQDLEQSLQKPLIQKLILYRKSSNGETEYTFGVDILRLWIKDQAASRIVIRGNKPGRSADGS